MQKVKINKTNVINFEENTLVDSNFIRRFKATNLPLDGIYEDEDGDIHYYKNGKKHNENGPAYVAKNGYEAYYINGKRYRIDGPAIIYSDGDYEWHINGHYFGKEIIETWLKENDIPLDWNIWTDSDKKRFENYWTEKYGTPFVKEENKQEKLVYSVITEKDNFLFMGTAHDILKELEKLGENIVSVKETKMNIKIL